MRYLVAVLAYLQLASAWTTPYLSQRAVTRLSSTTTAGNLHGQGACFLPLQQLDTDYYAPRILPIAGAYPGVTLEELQAFESPDAPEQGQWTYDFGVSKATGSVAIEGSATLYGCQDPVVIIAEHESLGVQLPEAIEEAVDLMVLVDRAVTHFAERAFLVLADSDGKLMIGAFDKKGDLPAGGQIVGHVMLVQIPWLPAMAPTKTGFLEADEYF